MTSMEAIAIVAGLLIGYVIVSAITRKSSQNRRVDDRHSRNEALPGDADLYTVENLSALNLDKEFVNRASRQGFVSRHWHGDYSLARSYWVNVVLLSALFQIITTPVLQMEVQGNSSTPMLAIVSVTFFVMLASVWQFVGLWRSSRNHINRTGRRFWARIAQILAVLGLLGVVSNTIVYGPVFREMTIIGLNMDPLDNLEFSWVDRDKDQLVLSGNIGFSGDKELQKWIWSGSESLWLVILESTGGRETAALAMAKTIEAHSLDTYVDSECDSACTLLFTAGDRRIASPGAIFGFHTAGIDGVAEGLLPASENDSSAYLYRRGISENFIKRVETVPYEDMWYPTLDELLKAKIGTHVMEGDELVSASDYARLYQ